MRRPKSHNAKSGQGHILDMVSIRERPAEIEDRAVPGHREGDLLTGANDTHIATLVERNTRFTMLVRIPRKDTTTVVAALAKHIGKLPEELRRSLTWDQGKEMSRHCADIVNVSSLTQLAALTIFAAFYARARDRRRRATKSFLAKCAVACVEDHADAAFDA